MSKYIPVIFILSTISQISEACEYLYGTWRSSMEESYKYASDNPEVKSTQLEFVKYAFGHMTLTFDKDTVKVHEAGEIDVIISGKNYPFEIKAETSSIKYKICTDEIIEVQYNHSGFKDTYQYFIVDENLYWVQLESEIGREYYRRIR